MADDPEAPPLARWLSVPGRILLLVTLLLFVGGSAAYILWTLEGLPAGRYPLVIWLVPVGLAGWVFFLVSARILEKIGVKIYQKPPAP